MACCGVQAAEKRGGKGLLVGKPTNITGILGRMKSQTLPQGRLRFGGLTRELRGINQVVTQSAWSLRLAISTKGKVFSVGEGFIEGV